MLVAESGLLADTCYTVPCCDALCWVLLVLCCFVVGKSQSLLRSSNSASCDSRVFSSSRFFATYILLLVALFIVVVSPQRFFRFSFPSKTLTKISVTLRKCLKLSKKLQFSRARKKSA